MTLDVEVNGEGMFFYCGECNLVYADLQGCPKSHKEVMFTVAPTMAVEGMS